MTRLRDTGFILLLLNKRGRLSRQEILKELNEHVKKTNPDFNKKSSMALDPERKYKTYGDYVYAEDGKLLTHQGYFQIHGSPYSKTTEFSLTEKGKLKVLHYLEVEKKLERLNNDSIIHSLAKAAYDGNEDARQVLVDKMIEMDVFSKSEIDSIRNQPKPLVLSKEQLKGWTLNPEFVIDDYKERTFSWKRKFASIFELLPPPFPPLKYPPKFINPPPSVDCEIIVEEIYSGNVVNTYVGNAKFVRYPEPVFLGGRRGSPVEGELEDIRINLPETIGRVQTRVRIVLHDGVELDGWYVNGANVWDTMYGPRWETRGLRV